jgi:hypothetical protein
MVDLFEAMKWILIIVWLIASVTQIWGALQKPHKKYDWIKFCLGLVSAYWAFYYAQSSFFRFITINHQVWVRTPLMLTGGVVAACGIYTLMRRRR